jgi:uncharacterized protein (TIGR02271 family)
VEPAVERTAQGWTIRVPVRREALTIEKRTVVAERVVIRRAVVLDDERIDVGLRREELRVRGEHARVTDGAPHDTLAGTGLEQDPVR